MSPTEFVVPVPLPVEAAGATSDGPRISSLEGQVVGIVNNNWGAMDHLSRFIETELRQGYGVADVIEFRNGHTAGATSPPTFRLSSSTRSPRRLPGPSPGSATEVAARRGVVTPAPSSSGGACGGVVVTSVFQKLAEYSLKVTERLPDHPLVVLPADKNLEYATEEELRAAARQTVRAIFGEPVGQHQVT